MGTLEVRQASKAFDGHVVLDNVDFTVGDGEFVVIVGPSGCGKSTLLRCIAGLDHLSHGTILIDGEDVSDHVPAKRGIAMVFQSYALYPHMTVRQNIAFPLTLARQSKPAVAARVDEVATILGVVDLLDRRPAELSGGQRQRVAIGRALARNPRLFLLDEPLSNLDAALRARMRLEFARLHSLSHTTTIYVTHDQVEAMTLADRIVVLQGGVVEQIGTPDALYRHPRNRFVAGFIGSPGMNFIEATVVAGDDGTMRCHPAVGGGFPEVPSSSMLTLGEPVTIGVRPETLAVSMAEIEADLKVGLVERLGATAIYHLEHPQLAEPIRWQSDNRPDIVRGQPVTLDLAQSRPLLFDRDGRNLAEV